MAVATTERNTLTKGVSRTVAKMPVAASTSILKGVLVATNAAGDVVNAADAAGLTVIGRAKTSVDNSAGAAGAKTIDIEKGVFKWAANTVTKARHGKVVYVTDNQTVQDATGTNSITAGILDQIDSDGVWVATL